MTAWTGWQPGMASPTIQAVKDTLRKRFTYCRALSPGPEYFAVDQPAIVEYQRRIHAEVMAGTNRLPDPRTDGAIDWAMQVQLGLIKLGPPPPPNRHLALVYRGTGGIIGQDYVSLVCQANDGLVEEVNPPWSATMGGLPVGTAGGPGNPSMAKGVADALAATIPIIDSALAEKPKRKIVVGGYSAGAVVAAHVRQYVQTNHPDNYLCSFSLGDPTRPKGGCYYPFDGAAQPGGQGIGSWKYGDIADPRHCWLANHTDPAGPDMYTITPRGVTGDIMTKAYDMVTQFAFTDMLSATRAIVQAIPQIAGDMGITVPTVLGALSRGLPGLLGFSIELALQSIGGLIPVGNPDTLTGTAAAAAAARIGLTFAAAGTGPHIRYHSDEIWLGQTYLGLAVQHVRFYASSVTPV